jgi:hypothetical protein
VDGEHDVIQLVSDGPPRRFLSILVPVVRKFVGVLLWVTAAAASVPLTAAFFALIVWIAFLTTDGDTFSLSSPIPRLGMSVNDVLLRAGVVTGASGLVGFILIRGNRRMVLFLRRFGDSEASLAVTVATRRIGRSWRLVTCDDAQLVPVGVAPSMAATMRLAERAPKVANTAWKTAAKWYRGVYRGVTFVAGIGALSIFISNTYGHKSGSASASHVRLLDSAEPSAVAFRLLLWVFLIGAALFVVRLVLSYVILPLLGFALIPLSGVSALLSMALDSARGAERLKMLPIKTQQDAEWVPRLVKRLFRGIFSPKLLVLTVDHPVWRQTVSSLMALTSVTLFDVTVPTESLLWELNELNRRSYSRVLFIAHQNFADRIFDRAARDEPESVEAEMLRLLDDKNVLLYTTDRRGLRRFAQALHATLEATA